MQNQRNILLAVLLTGLILFGWDALVGYIYPQANKPRPVASAPANVGTAPKPTREGGLTSATDLALEAKDLKSALGAGGRVQIAAPGLSGSINLTGALLDDLTIEPAHRDAEAGGRAGAHLLAARHPGAAFRAVRLGRHRRRHAQRQHRLDRAAGRAADAADAGDADLDQPDRPDFRDPLCESTRTT